MYENERGYWERHPWDMMDGEGPKAFEAFCAYRDMGAKRAQRKVPEAIGRPDSYISVIYRWSIKYKWSERVRAFDDYQDKVARNAALEEIENMRKRHIQQAVGLQTKALERLRDMQATELTAANVLSFIQEAVKIERMARGEPDQIMEERRRLTEDEAREVSKLAADPEFMGRLQGALEKTEGSDPADGSTGSVAEE